MRASAWPSAGVASLAPSFALGWALAGREPGLGAQAGSWQAVSAVGFALLLAGGVVTAKASVAGRWLSTLGLAALVLSALPQLVLSPALTLASLIVFVALMGIVWGSKALGQPSLSRRRVRELTESRARIASTIFLAQWLAVAVFVPEALGMPHVRLALLAGWVVSLGYVVVWVAAARRRGDGRWRFVALAASAGLVGSALFARSFAGVVTASAPALLVVSCLPRYGAARRRQSFWVLMGEHPARLLVVTFLALIAAGTLVLLFPICTSTGEGVALIDAAFTAVSAVCVTGLIVLDTPVAFSFAGETVLLVLMQLGGLGIMSLSSVTLALRGRRASLRHETAVAGLVGSDNLSTLGAAVRRVVVFTFAAEAVGAAVLTAAFLQGGETFLSALWRGVFTAVSAFCNAGFALQSDSLMSYQQSPVVLHAVAALIVLGGLSPAAVAALVVKARHGQVSLEHKLSFLATLGLLVLGTVAILSFEWSNTLDGLSLGDRFSNAWFQSVTSRTAGFNSVDIAATAPATSTVLMLLMFIGGSPGGTAGGVKTTTVAVLLIGVAAAISGRSEASIFYRRIAPGTIHKAVSITTMGMLSVAFALVVMQLTQSIDSGLILFEVVSALGTVGLSTGATPLLDGVGKVVIMVCMFAGRVGPLSFFLFFHGRSRRPAWRFVEEEVSVG